MKVNILATCRNPELWRATELVFRTFRIGFPTYPVRVFFNRLDRVRCSHIEHLMWPAGPGPNLSTYVEVDTDHWSWIKNLVENEKEPFWICDTDVVFWSPIERWLQKGRLSGRLMPRFREEFTGAICQPRLHTSLLYVNPDHVRRLIHQYNLKTPECWFLSPPDLFKPQIVPRMGDNLFYDTASMLYNAIGGEPFPEHILNCYDHLHGACSADIIGPHMTDGKKVEHDKMACENPQLIKGSWKAHDAYFRNKAA